MTEDCRFECSARSDLWADSGFAADISVSYYSYDLSENKYAGSIVIEVFVNVEFKETNISE